MTSNHTEPLHMSSDGFKTFSLKDLKDESTITDSWAEDTELEDLPSVPLARMSSSTAQIDFSAVSKHGPYVARIKNMSYDAAEADVAAFLGRLRPKSLSVLRDREGRSRGFALAEFETRDDLVAAMRLGGKPFLGRTVTIVVDEKREGRFGKTSSASLGFRSGTDSTEQPQEKQSFNFRNKTDSEVHKAAPQPLLGQFRQGGDEKPGIYRLNREKNPSSLSFRSKATSSPDTGTPATSNTRKSFNFRGNKD